MKRNYQSGAQKRQAKSRKIAEASKNSQQLSSWLTRPETFEAVEQDVSIRDTKSTPQLVDVNSFNNSTNEENSDTTKDRSDASKNDNFPTIIVNSEIKKAIITTRLKQPKGTFPKDSLTSPKQFFIFNNLLPLCNTIRPEITNLLVMLFIKHGSCLLPALLVIFS